MATPSLLALLTNPELAQPSNVDIQPIAVNPTQIQQFVPPQLMEPPAPAPSGGGGLQGSLPDIGGDLSQAAGIVYGAQNTPISVQESIDMRGREMNPMSLQQQPQIPANGLPLAEQFAAPASEMNLNPSYQQALPLLNFGGF